MARPTAPELSVSKHPFGRSGGPIYRFDMKLTMDPVMVTVLVEVKPGESIAYGKIENITPWTDVVGVGSKVNAPTPVFVAVTVLPVTSAPTPWPNFPKTC